LSSAPVEPSTSIPDDPSLEPERIFEFEVSFSARLAPGVQQDAPGGHSQLKLQYKTVIVFRFGEEGIMTTRFCPITVFVVLLMAGAPVITNAQAGSDSFGQLSDRVRAGDTVYVVDFAGNETKGKVSRISDSSLELIVGAAHRDFSPSTVSEIRRRGDPLWNGLVIGAVAGLGTGFLGGRNRGEEGEFFPAVGILGCVIGGGIGLGLDAFIQGRQLVYRAPERPTSSRMALSPTFSKGGIAVAVTARF
jgi:hypothetical protein